LLRNNSKNQEGAAKKWKAYGKKRRDENRTSLKSDIEEIEKTEPCMKGNL